MRGIYRIIEVQRSLDNRFLRLTIDHSLFTNHTMNFAKITLITGIFLLSAFSHTVAQRIIDVDICVYGGTSAGVVAAYTAQTLGKKAILIETGKRLGGLTTGGLGYTDIGNKYAISGISRDFY